MEDYDRVTKRLKSTLMSKDKSYLTELIHTPVAMQRILMKKLLREHRENITKELTKLRFTQIHAPDRDLDLAFLEKHNQELLEVDLVDLPETFVEEVFNIIKICANDKVDQGIDDDDIVEVPVPPKPPAPLIDLESENDDAEKMSPNEEKLQGKSDKNPNKGELNNSPKSTKSANESESAKEIAKNDQNGSGNKKSPSNNKSRLDSPVVISSANNSPNLSNSNENIAGKGPDEEQELMDELFKLQERQQEIMTRLKEIRQAKKH